MLHVKTPLLAVRCIPVLAFLVTLVHFSISFVRFSLKLASESSQDGYGSEMEVVVANICLWW